VRRANAFCKVTKRWNEENALLSNLIWKNEKITFLSNLLGMPRGREGWKSDSKVQVQEFRQRYAGQHSGQKSADGPGKVSLFSYRYLIGISHTRLLPVYNR
jgi:hypothetical protein